MSTQQKLRVGIIGAGLIGGKRAASLPQERCELVAVSDLQEARASELAAKYGARVIASPWELLAKKEIEIVILAATNDVLVPFALAALEENKSVLVEKPAGRNPAELRKLVEATQRSSGMVRVGFNHRFHPALQKAKAKMGEAGFGELMYFRGRYGHGARVGYDREWRADPAVAGGGELLDQGVHLIDLCRWLGGEFELDCGRAKTFFWDMPVEDNGFMLLNSPDKKRSAFLHASCTEWKNIFDFEIFGRTAKLQVAGLGRSYGIEELRHYQMKPEMGPPDFHTETFPGEDLSWNLEFSAFLAEREGLKTDIGTAQDALRAVEIVYQVYEQSQAASR